jgi:hypothetical protein
VTGSAGFGTAGVLSGDVGLGDDGAIEFAGGQITSMGANSLLFLAGNQAFIEDSTAVGSNSALMGLDNIGAGANLILQQGSTVSTTSGLVNDGTVILRSKASLTVAGTLTNDGSISITTDTEALAGAVGGKGSFTLSNAHLRFGSSVSAGQTINDRSGADALTLKEAQKFHATISGFGTGDTIDAANFLFSGIEPPSFVENSGGTGGTLTLHDGSLTANILMTGVYTRSNFSLVADSGTGTLVKFV